MLDKQHDQLLVSALLRELNARFLHIIGCLYVCLVLQEQFYHLFAPKLARKHQRRSPEAVPLFNISTKLHKAPDTGVFVLFNRQ